MKGNRSMQDMTEGRPISLILKFFFPLLFGMLFQQFYNLVDTAIVGKFLGPDDLAAVGATGSVNFLILGFCMGVSSVLVSSVVVVSVVVVSVVAGVSVFAAQAAKANTMVRARSNAMIFFILGIPPFKNFTIRRGFARTSSTYPL